jgi:hypothetical protein
MCACDLTYLDGIVAFIALTINYMASVSDVTFPNKNNKQPVITLSKIMVPDPWPVSTV